MADETREVPDDPSSAQPARSGRFSSPASEDLMTFTRSVDVDRYMWREDIEGSRAHVRALEKGAILSPEEANELLHALDEVAREFEAGQFEFRDSDEDIHMAIERRVSEIAGEVGGKLHTGRSRNDQVVLDLRLYISREARQVAIEILNLATELVKRAEGARDHFMPGYTHLQRAQPVLLAHHLCAHVWPLIRDIARMRDACTRSNVSPLGAGALAGTSLSLDPKVTAALLGMERTFENSMDAVSDRDFVAEHLFVLAMAQIHLSRLAEDVILWSSEEFRYLDLPDEWATGSSMMPQKKNPDVAELVRGRTGRTLGNLVNLMVVLKGLPLTYNRDLQEDKGPLFDSIKVVKESARALSGLICGAEFNFEAMEDAASDGHLGATDLAEELVRAGIAFREAHKIVGELILELENEGRSLETVTQGELARLDPALASMNIERLSVRSLVESRLGDGATGSDVVIEQIARARGEISILRDWAIGVSRSDDV